MYIYMPYRKLKTFKKKRSNRKKTRSRKQRGSGSNTCILVRLEHETDAFANKLLGTIPASQENMEYLKSLGIASESIDKNDIYKRNNVLPYFPNHNKDYILDEQALNIPYIERRPKSVKFSNTAKINNDYMIRKTKYNNIKVDYDQKDYRHFQKLLYPNMELPLETIKPSHIVLELRKKPTGFFGISRRKNACKNNDLEELGNLQQIMNLIWSKDKGWWGVPTLEEINEFIERIN